MFCWGANINVIGNGKLLDFCDWYQLQISAKPSTIILISVIYLHLSHIILRKIIADRFWYLALFYHLTVIAIVCIWSLSACVRNYASASLSWVSSVHRLCVEFQSIPNRDKHRLKIVYRWISGIKTVCPCVLLKIVCDIDYDFTAVLS